MTNELRADPAYKYIPGNKSSQAEASVGFYTNVTRVYCALGMVVAALLALGAVVTGTQGYGPGAAYSAALLGASAVGTIFSVALVGVLAEISRKLGALK